jgi:hypothetical protein
MSSGICLALAKILKLENLPNKLGNLICGIMYGNEQTTRKYISIYGIIDPCSCPVPPPQKTTHTHPKKNIPNKN